MKMFVIIFAMFLAGHASGASIEGKITVTNKTLFKLDCLNIQNVARGKSAYTVTAIEPGATEQIAMFNKDSDGGVWGVVSWEVGGQGRRIVLMQSIPYDTSRYGNWFGAGLSTDRRPRFDSSYFDQMYYNENDNHLQFHRSTRDIDFELDGFTIIGKLRRPDFNHGEIEFTVTYSDEEK